MHTATHRKLMLCMSLFAAAFAIFLAQAAEPVTTLKPTIVDDTPLEPPPPDDDPDAPVDPVIPDPYVGLPEPGVIDNPIAKGEWIKVSYLVYSGLPNPVVLLGPGSEYEAIERALSAAINNPENVLPDYDPLPVLGYTGILVERFSEGTQLYSFTVQGDILSTGPESIKENYAIVSPAAVELETSLLSLGQSHEVLSPIVLSVINDSKSSPYSR